MSSAMDGETSACCSEAPIAVRLLDDPFHVLDGNAINVVGGLIIQLSFGWPVVRPCRPLWQRHCVIWQPVSHSTHPVDVALVLRDIFPDILALGLLGRRPLALIPGFLAILLLLLPPWWPGGAPLPFGPLCLPLCCSHCCCSSCAAGPSCCQYCCESSRHFSFIILISSSGSARRHSLPRGCHP